MKPKIFQWLGMTLILETGLIHYYTAQSQYDKSGYMGYVYVAYFLATLIAAFGIHYRQVWGWGIGLVLSVNSIITFIWSRTLGLPGMAIEDWLAPFAIVAASVEVLFVILYLMRPWRIQTADSSLSTDSRLRYILPVAGLFVISTVSAFAYQWDFSVAQAYGHHVGSLDQVCSTPLTSLAELEERYGVQVSLVATSMMDTIVDVRLKVIDPEKATGLLKNQAALLVDQQVLVLAPHQHHHGSIMQDKIHFLFFPTQNRTIHTGSMVSLVFGPIRVEPVTVK